MKQLIVIRHSEYEDDKGSQGSLTARGREQADKLQGQMYELLGSLGGLSSTARFRSNTKRADEMLQWCSPPSSVLVVMKCLIKGSWGTQDADNLQDLVRKIIGHCEIEQAECALVVGHGNSPAALVGAALILLGREVPGQLKTQPPVQSDYARGYLLDLESGDVYRLSPDGYNKLT